MNYLITCLSSLISKHYNTNNNYQVFSNQSAVFLDFFSTFLQSLAYLNLKQLGLINKLVAFFIVSVFVQSYSSATSANDLPTLSISSPSVSGGLSEGLDLEFTVHSDQPVAEDLAVSIVIVEYDGVTRTNRFDLDVEPSSGVVIAAGTDATKATAILNEQTVGLADDKWFIVQIYPYPPRYNVSPTSNEIVVRMKDNFPTRFRPRISLRSVADSVDEGGLVTFSVEANTGSDNLPPATNPLPVHIEISNATGEFIAPSESLSRTVMLTNAISQELIRVNTIPLNLSESNGVVRAQVVESADYILAPNLHQQDVNITNRTQPIYWFEQVSITAAESDTNITFTVNRSNTTTNSTTVDFEISGDLLAGEDYIALASNTLTFAPSEVSKQLTIQLIDDQVDELDESITVTLTESSSGSIFYIPYITTATITDNDTAIASVPTMSVYEGNAGQHQAMITISLSPVSTREVSLYWHSFTLRDDTALFNRDFYETDGTVTFAPMQSTVQIAQPIIGDITTEADEHFTILLFNATGGAEIQNSIANITIIDDEGLTLSFQDPTPEINEDVGNYELSVNLSGPSGYVEYTYEVIGTTATAGTDFLLPVSLTGTIENSNSGTISIPIADDNEEEDDETFTVRITSVQYANFAGNATNIEAVVTILSNDAPILSFTNANTFVEEDVRDGYALVAVNLDKAAKNNVTVRWYNYASSAETATFDVDFRGEIGGSIEIYAGQTSGTIRVAIYDDQVLEGPETFKVGIMTITNAEIVNDAGTTGIHTTVTITDYEDRPTLNFDNYSPTIDEDAGTVNLAVSLTNQGSSPASVTWSINNGTATGGEDFVSQPNQVLTGITNDTNGLIAIQILSNSTYEGNETFTITLSSPQHAFFPNRSDSLIAEVTIIDDTDLPVLSIPSTTVRVVENPARQRLEIPATLTGSTELAASAHYITFEGTARDAINYIHFDLPLSYPVGDTQALIKVPIIENFQADGDKNFTITISNPEHLKFANDVSQITIDVTIVDDESLPVIEILPPTTRTLENTGPVTFTLTATQMSTPTALTLRYTPAEVASDFLATTVQDQDVDTVINFRPNSEGNYTGEITVPIDNDSAKEATGEIQVSLKTDPAFPASTYVVGATNNATATILDDEAPELVITSGPFATEGPNQTVKFNVTARHSPNRSIRVKFNVSQRSSGTGNFIANTGDRLIDVDFSGNQSTVIVSIDLTNDDIAEDDGYVRLAVVADESDPINYSVPTGAESWAEVKVFDDENSATLSIAGSTRAIPERDGVVTFDIFADSDPRRALAVRYAPAEVDSGDFLDASTIPNQEAITTQTLNFEPTGLNDRYSAELVVPIHDDNVGERSGAIRVTILTDDATNSYVVASDGSETATVAILDDDAPELTITALSQVTEGTNHSANFQISTQVRPTSPVTVYYTPVSANFLSETISGSKQQTVAPIEFSDTAPFTSILNVPIDRDIVTEATGQIAVTLEAESTPATTYTVASSPSNTATVPVTIVEFLPLLTIMAPTAATSEADGEVDFTITTTSQITGSLNVRYTPSEVAGGNFLDAEADPSQEATMTQPLSFISSNNRSIATLPVSIHVDSAREATGQIQVTLLDDNQPTLTYRIANDGTQIARATILDDEVPELSISGGGPVTEGLNHSLIFTVNATFSPNQPLRVYNGILQSSQGDGNFIGNSFNGYFDLDFSNGAITSRVSIPVTNDDVEETSGVVGVVLADDEADPITYTVVAGDNSSAEISVYDDDSLPILSLLGPVGSVLESEGMVNFSVISDREPYNSLVVRYQPAEVATGNFLDETTDPNQEALTSQTLTFTPYGNDGQYSSTLSIPIHDDEVHESTGAIQLTLVADDSAPTTYFVATDGTETAMATILDDDAPVLSITGGADVTEGPNRYAQFTISAVVLPESALTIKYLPESVNFLGTGVSGNPQTTATPLEFLGVGPYTTTLAVAIDNDTNAEVNGPIRVTLQAEDIPGTTYTVANFPENTAVVNVIDDDSLPLLTITAPLNPTPENEGQVDFTITTETNPGSSVRLRYIPAEVATGNFLDENANPSQESTTTQTINFSPTNVRDQYAAVLPVAIHDDDVGEQTGAIQVTLLSDNAMVETYRVASTGSEIAVASIADDDTPQLSITGVGPVTEGVGRVAQFTISSHAMPDAPLTINYTPESTNFLVPNIAGEPQTTPTPLAFSGDGPYTTTLEVTLDDDGIAEATGRVTVTLNEENQPGTTYLVDSSPSNTAVVEITDDDSLPLLAILNPTTPIVESAGQVIFGIETTMFPGSTVIVRYLASEVASGNYLDADANPSQEAITSQSLSFAGTGNSYLAHLTIPIHNDNVGEPTGEIMVTLLADNNAVETYRIASDGSQIATATIWDDDAPEMTITGNAAVTEDYSQTVSFTISTNVRPRTGIQFDYLPESTIYLASGITGTRQQTPHQLNFSGNGPYTTTLTVDFNSNTTKDGNNRITVTLLEQLITNKTYTVAKDPHNSAFVEIIDDESIPVLSTRLTQYQFPESEGFVEIQLIATNNPTTPIPIRYSTGEYLGGDFLDETASPSQEGPGTQFVTFVNSGRETVGTFRIPIHNDDVGERNGSVKISIFSDNSPQVAYKLLRAGTIITYIGVLDDDAPELSISGGGNVTEGINEVANFSISTKIRPKNPLVVDYIPTSTNFLAPGESGVKVSSNPLTFTGNGPFTARLQVPIDDDDVLEAGGTIAVQLVEESPTPFSTYTVINTSANRSTVWVRDVNLLPKLSISNPVRPIPESDGEIDFLVMTELDEAENFNVRYIASEVGAGNFLDENASPSQEVANSQSLNFEQIGNTRIYSATLTVPIHNDNVGERRGTILVNLLADNAPTETYVVASGEAGVAAAKILDDDAPELTIRPGGTVTEGFGQTANFVITSEVLPPRALTLRYRPLSISYLAPGVSGSDVTATNPITFSGAGPYTAILPIPIDNDDVVEATNLLTVMLLEEETPATSYTVAPTPYNASYATVADDDLLPLIEISAPTEPTNENAGNVIFTLSTLVNPVDPLTIRYDPSEVATGDFLNADANPSQEAINSQTVDFNFDRNIVKYTGQLEVPIHNDQVGERAGEIGVTLLPDDNGRWTYQVAHNGTQSVKATILDDDVPILSIANGEATTEGVGRNANYTITASFLPTAPLTINYRPESTNFLASGESGTPTSTQSPLTFTTESPFTAVLPVPIDNDEIAESNGFITVTLLDESTIGSTYIVAASPHNQAEVSVTDDDTLPDLTLSSLVDPTPESDGVVDFIVVTTTDLGINTSITVRYQASEVASGNFLNETASPSQEEPNSSPLVFELDSETSNYKATLSVPIHNDDVGETTGSISVSLLPDSMLSESYRVASDGSETATAIIWDDDAPELSIADGPAVTEGLNRMVKFPVSALVSPNQRLTLGIMVSKQDEGSGNFLVTSGTTTTIVDFRDQATSATLSIPISSDDVIEDNGTIRVVLMADNASPVTYFIAEEPNNTADVMVVDDDSLPLLQIISPAGSTPERDAEVVFKVSSIQNPEGPLTVRYSPSEVQSGDFLNENALPSQEAITTQTISFTHDQENDSYVANLLIPIHDDLIGESTGEISVELLTDDQPAETYRIDTNNSNTVNATIWDDDAPELRITAGTFVTENLDQNAMFTITSYLSPNRNLTLFYTTSQPQTGAGNFLVNEGSDSQILDFTKNKTSISLLIPIATDDIAELDGSITVTLASDQADPITYTTTNSPQNSASVQVIDDDSIPILSILPPAGPTPESNGNVTFTVIADRDPRTNFFVWYTPSEVALNDFLNANASPSQEIETSQQLNFSPLGEEGRYRAELTIPIHDDDQGENTGSIRVTLQVDQSTIELYRIKNDGTETATAVIWDDDAPELLIADGPAVVEMTGRFAKFPISTPISPNRSVMVYFTLSQRNSGNGDFLTREGDLFEILDFTGGKMTATLSIPIAADEMLETNGDIKVTLNADQANPITYTVTGEPDNFAYVPIIDQLSLPILSILEPSAPVAENEGMVNFTLSTERLLNDSITVRYQVAEVASGDFLNENASPSQEAIATQLVQFSQIGGSGPYLGTLSVPIHNDAVGESTGAIAATLLADDSTSAETYFVVSDGSNSAEATIWDDDAPELHIEGLHAVTEAPNQTADFEVTARVSPNKKLEVYYTVFQPSIGNGNFVETIGPDQVMLDFRNNSSSDTLSIPIFSDLAIEDNGVIRVVLTADSADLITYTVADSPANIAEVTVIDDDSLPYISITAPNSSVLESEGGITFTISSPVDLGTSALIYYLPAEVLDGDFLNENASPSQEVKTSQAISFSQENGSETYDATLTIPIHDDSIGESTGAIAVTLVADESHAQTYRIRQDGTETVNVTILDDDAPELSIQAGNAITEGPQVTANFTLVARTQPRSPLYIRYLPESDNFLAAGISENIQETDAPLVFDYDMTNQLITATLSVEIEDDDYAEVNGDLTVTLIADDTDPITYTLASEVEISATVQVYDNDTNIPTLSIASPATPQPESAGFVDFQLTADINPGRALALRYTPENVNSDNFLATTSGETITTDQVIEFSDNGSGVITSTLRVAIDDDLVPESTGMITVTLNSDPATPVTYHVASGSSASATATIWDNDAPELSIAGGEPISEGVSSGQAVFIIATHVQPLSPITVFFTPESAGYINNSGQPDSQPLTFDDDDADGIYTAELAINIVQDLVPEINGEIIVTLSPDSRPDIDYTLGETFVASQQISDDDASIPELTLSGSTTVLRENVGQVSFKVSAMTDPQRPIELRYTPSETGGDFLDSETENTKTIPNFVLTVDEDGLFTAEIQIPIVNDETPEPDGVIQVALEPDSNNGILQTYTLGSQSTFAVNIWDDELPELTISAGEDVFEGPSVTANFIVYATLMPRSTLQIRYIPTSENFLATGVSGTIQKSEALTFVESGTRGTYMSVLKVTIAEDNMRESDEQLAVALEVDDSHPPKYTLGSTITASINVADNDTPRFNISNSEIVEGDAGQSSLNFIVTLQPPSQQEQRIRWLTTTELGDSAEQNQDFVAGNGELIFLAGEFEQTITIPVIGDTALELEESFSVVLFEASTNDVVLGNIHARGIILNDDFELAIENVEIVEGDSGSESRMPFAITLAPEPSREIELTWEAKSLNSDSATANEDYDAGSGQIEITANQTEQSLEIVVRGDNAAEFDETFTVELTLQAGGGKVINAVAIGTILNDDTGISIADGSIIEGNSGEIEMEFELTLAPVSTQTVTVDWATALSNQDTASFDSDFETASDTLRFSAGESSKSIRVKVFGDTIPELAETFSIELSNPTAGIELLNSAATGTIQNDDYGLRISDATSVEGENGEITEMVFDVVLDPPLDNKAISVDWRTESITGEFAAGELDYLNANGTLIFNPNETQQSIIIEIYDDVRVEPSEQFAITLFDPAISPPSEVQVGLIDATGLGTIEDNDVAELRVESASVQEVENETIEMNFTIRLTPPYSQDFVVNWQATSEADDLAREKYDFRAESGELLFGAGEIEKTITVQIFDDEEVEPDETFTVIFTEQIADIAFINSKVKGTIRDNDKFLGRQVISVAANAESIMEGEAAEFTISAYPELPENESLMIGINVSQTGDFLMWRSPATLMLSGGGTTFICETQDDEIEESEGAITVTLVEQENSYIISQGGEMASIAVISDDIGEVITNEPKISVASSAVNSILTQIQRESLNEPSFTGSEQNLPMISITAVDTTVDEGELAEFIIILKGGSGTEEINFDVQVSEVGESINWPVSTSVEIRGNSSVLFRVETFNDEIAEENGEVLVKLPASQEYIVSETAGSAVVTILDVTAQDHRKDDLLARSQIALDELMRTVGTTTSESITQRISQGFSNNHGVSLEVGGKGSVPEMLKRNGSLLNDNTLELRSFLDDSVFSMPLLSSDVSTFPATLWGRGKLNKFNLDGTEFGENWTGDNFTGQFGIDTLIGDELLAGLSTSVTKGQLESKNSNNDDLLIVNNISSFSPYIGWTSANQQTKLQVIANFGSGLFEFEQEQFESEFVDGRFNVVAASGSKLLFTSENFLGGTSNLSMNGDVWLAHQIFESQNSLFSRISEWSHHIEVDSELSQTYEFEQGSVLSPNYYLGLQLDNVDNQSVLGLNLKNEIKFHVPNGLSLTGIGQFSFTANNDAYNQMVGGVFEFDKFNDELGLNLLVQSHWGNLNATNEQNYGIHRHLENTLDRGQLKNKTQISSEIGYGMNIFDQQGTFKPFGRFELADEGQVKYSVGSHFSVGSKFDLEIEAESVTSNSKIYDKKFQLKGVINW